MPKIEIEVRIIGSKATWKEEYDCPDDPQIWAENLINNFNATLRFNEQPRELVGVEILNENTSTRKHDWRKQNLITIVRGSISYDKMQCRRCGVTGKRYGLDAGVKRDSKYKAMKYDVCNG